MWLQVQVAQERAQVVHADPVVVVGEDEPFGVGAGGVGVEPL